MDFPLIPLPKFLLNIFDNMENLHSESSFIFALMCGIFGLLLILMWSPYNDNLDEKLPLGGTIKDRVKLGFILLGMSLLSLVFGLYLIVPIYAAFAVYGLCALVSSFKNVFIGNKERVN